MQTLVTLLKALVIGEIFCLALISSAVAAPWTRENSAWNVNFNPNPKDPAQYYGSWPNHKYYPSSSDWRGEAVYHVMLDRFRDGDPNNNQGMFGGYNVLDIGMRHGGDFKGLEDKLDYIKTMGFSAIWISPIFLNGYNEYFGYGPIDMTLIDDRLGTLEEFRRLISAAHNRGIYVFVDIVVNHLSYHFYFEGYENSTAPFRMHRGEYRLLERPGTPSYQDFQVNNTFDPKGTYPAVYDKEGTLVSDNSGTGSFWESDFHHNGTLRKFQDPWQIHLGKIYDRYDDLRTEHPRVQDKIIAMTKALVTSTDIDGIRIDTPLQVPVSFFKRWIPAVKEHARALGKNDFFMFGELYGNRARSAVLLGRGKTPADYGKENKFIDSVAAMDGGINYGFYKTTAVPILRNIKKNSFAIAFQNLELDFKAYDLWSQAHQEYRYQMLNFFDNHDQRRLSTAIDGLKKLDLAVQLIAFWPGIPNYYYGDEQRFSSFGSAYDGHAREDMMTSLAWSDHPAALSPNPAQADNFDMSSPSYLAVLRAMSLRRLYPEVYSSDRIGSYWIEKSADKSLFAFTRVNLRNETTAFVVVNPSDREKSLDQANLQEFQLTGDWVDAYDRAEQIVQAGKLIISRNFRPYSASLFVPAKMWRPLNPYVISIDPKHDSVVEGQNVVVSVEFSEALQTNLEIRTVTVDGQQILPKDISLDQGAKRLSFPLTFTSGVHEIVISKALNFQSGRSLQADFHARLRSGEPSSVLIKGSVVRDLDLIKGLVLVKSGVQVTLFHKTPAARWFRVSDNGGVHWSDWSNYQPRSHWVLPLRGGWKDVLVQYWIDGSAAYFVKGGVDIVIGDGISSGDFKVKFSEPLVPSEASSGIQE